MAKLWKGRFKQGTHPLMEQFSQSISFDRELVFHDIKGSIAHAGMLKAVGLLTVKEFSAIRKGLLDIEADIKLGKFVYRTEDEDIHMAVEAELSRRIGEPAGKLHTARSRNDQTATALRLWTRDKIDALDGKVRALQQSLLEVAKREKDFTMPGYTHLQRAQPVLLAQHLLAYVEMFARDRERLADARKRVDRMPLGSCALAGTTIAIRRELTRKELAFSALCDNSMDAVGDRDFVVETLSVLSLIQVHLSRFSEDVILWTSSEWNLAKLDDAWSTGSSIMPQKRNPDLLELTRGKTGRVVGSLMAMLTIVKGLPMTYNRDLQEDKEPLFDAVRTVEASLECMAAFVPTLTFNRRRACDMLSGGFLEATMMAEYLVERGLPFRKAHEVCGSLVRIAEDREIRLAELTMDELRKASPLFSRDVYSRLEAANAPAAYRSAGGSGKGEVAKSIARWTKLLAKTRKTK